MVNKVHRVRFYNPVPQSIICISYNQNNKLVAVARNQASIEIWDLNHAPIMLKFIPGVENGSIEAVGWVHNRLLSTGLAGSLVEWDLNNLCLKTSVLLTGYAGWCLDVNSENTQVAVGTEQGYVNLYTVENDDIVYLRLFDKQEGRIMCCKFDKMGNMLITGSIDTIRIWNVANGHAVNRISTSRRGKEVIIWCLAVLTDNTIVSGDSDGRLTFWDSSTGDQIDSFTTHKADILTLVVAENEKSIYCSGVDPTIVNFIKVDMNKKSQASEYNWVKNVHRHVHEHDVRGLALQGEKLLSVGADGYLTFSNYPPKWVMRVPPMLPAPRSYASPKKKLLLLRYVNYLEVWQLGTVMTKENGKLVFADNTIKSISYNQKKNGLEQDTTISSVEKTKKGQPLKVASFPSKMVTIWTKGKKQLQCCALSPDGQYIIYSTDSTIRMLKLEEDECARFVSLLKVPINASHITTCDRAVFTEDSNMVIMTSSGMLHILQVDKTGTSIQQSIAINKYLKTNCILHLLVSKETSNGTTYLVVGDSSGAIGVWTRVSKSKFAYYTSLPKYECVPSAISFDNENNNLIITYVDQKVIQYDLLQKKINDSFLKSLPKEWYDRKSAVHSIKSNPQNNDSIIFQDVSSLWIFDNKNKYVDETLEPSTKKTKKPNQEADFRVIPIKYLADIHWLENDEMVFLEMLPEKIVSQLPPILSKK